MTSSVVFYEARGRSIRGGIVSQSVKADTEGLNDTHPVKDVIRLRNARVDHSVCEE